MQNIKSEVWDINSLNFKKKSQNCMQNIKSEVWDINSQFKKKSQNCMQILIRSVDINSQF